MNTRLEWCMNEIDGNMGVAARAVTKFGERSQLNKTIEELVELMSDVINRINGKDARYSLAGEGADVLIMVMQIREIVGRDVFDMALEHKVERLSGLIDGYEA